MQHASFSNQHKHRQNYSSAGDQANYSSTIFFPFKSVATDI
jgi:hypothetical protein